MAGAGAGAGAESMDKGGAGAKNIYFGSATLLLGVKVKQKQITISVLFGDSSLD